MAETVTNPGVVTAVLAVIALIGTVTMTLVTAYTIRLGKQQDFDRQDRIAKALEKRNRDAPIEAKQTAVAVATATKSVDVKLDVIHSLVNSAMTAAIQATLDATVVSLSALRALARSRKLASLEPDTDTENLIIEAEKSITSLRKVLEERNRQAMVVNQQLIEATIKKDQDGN